jgi:hypothetical protein
VIGYALLGRLRWIGRAILLAFPMFCPAAIALGQPTQRARPVAPELSGIPAPESSLLMSFGQTV